MWWVCSFCTHNVCWSQKRSTLTHAAEKPLYHSGFPISTNFFLQYVLWTFHFHFFLNCIGIVMTYKHPQKLDFVQPKSIVKSAAGLGQATWTERETQFATSGQLSASHQDIIWQDLIPSSNLILGDWIDALCVPPTKISSVSFLQISILGDWIDTRNLGQPFFWGCAVLLVSHTW